MPQAAIDRAPSIRRPPLRTRDLRDSFSMPTSKVGGCRRPQVMGLAVRAGCLAARELGEPRAPRLAPEATEAAWWPGPVDPTLRTLTTPLHWKLLESGRPIEAAAQTCNRPRKAGAQNNWPMMAKTKCSKDVPTGAHGTDVSIGTQQCPRTLTWLHARATVAQLEGTGRRATQSAEPPRRGATDQPTEQQGWRATRPAIQREWCRPTADQPHETNTDSINAVKLRRDGSQEATATERVTFLMGNGKPINNVKQSPTGLLDRSKRETTLTSTKCASAADRQQAIEPLVRWSQQLPH